MTSLMIQICVQNVQKGNIGVLMDGVFGRLTFVMGMISVEIIVTSGRILMIVQHVGKRVLGVIGDGVLKIIRFAIVCKITLISNLYDVKMSNYNWVIIMCILGQDDCNDWSDETEEQCPCADNENRCDVVDRPPGTPGLPGDCKLVNILPKEWFLGYCFKRLFLIFWDRFTGRILLR